MCPWDKFKSARKVVFLCCHHGIMNDARSAASHPATPQHALLNFFTTHVSTLHFYRMFDPGVETSGAELPWLPSPQKNNSVVDPD